MKPTALTIQKRLALHLGRTPDTSRAIWVAPNATVIGDVTLGPKSRVFYGAVLRGDIARIVVGRGSNLQDNVVVHLADDGDAIIMAQRLASELGLGVGISSGANLLGSPGQWRKWLAHDPADIEAVRRAARTGRPCGSGPFVSRLEYSLTSVPPRPVIDSAAGVCRGSSSETRRVRASVTL